MLSVIRAEESHVAAFKRSALAVVGAILLITAKVALSDAPRPPVCDLLITAVQSDDAAKALDVINRGCPVDARLDGSGATALMWSQSVNMTRTLIRAGSDVSKSADNGATALGNAAFHGSLDILNVLLSAGANPNIAGTYECGPLCEAMSGSVAMRMDIVKILLGHHADPNVPDCFNATAPFKALRLKQLALLQAVLAAGGNPNWYETTNGNPLIIVAAAESDSSFLEAILNAGANANWPNVRSCRTALHAAAVAGNVRAVNALLAKGADPKATDTGGQTALGTARDAGHPEVAALFEARGAPAAGVPRDDCVNSVDSHEAWLAWNAARARARVPVCAALPSSMRPLPGVRR
jgi:ankyrin repeat protein